MQNKFLFFMSKKGKILIITLIIFILAVVVVKKYDVKINSFIFDGRKIKTEIFRDVQEFEFKIVRPYVDQEYLYDYFMFRGEDPTYTGNGCTGMDYDFSFSDRKIDIHLKGVTTHVAKVKGQPIMCTEVPLRPGFSEKINVSDGSYNLVIKNKNQIDNFTITVKGEYISIEPVGSPVFSEGKNTIPPKPIVNEGVLNIIDNKGVLSDPSIKRVVVKAEVFKSSSHKTPECGTAENMGKCLFIAEKSSGESVEIGQWPKPEDILKHPAAFTRPTSVAPNSISMAENQISFVSWDWGTCGQTQQWSMNIKTGVFTLLKIKGTC